jgi:hypothetical protein
MAREKTIKVYKFSELSDKAKARVKYDHQVHGDDIDTDAYLASIKALAAHFGAKVKDYEIDWSGGAAPSLMSFEVPERESVVDVPDDVDGNDEAAYDAALDKAWEAWLKGKLDELGQYNPETLKGVGECKLTGYGYDDDAIDGFRKAFHEGERDLESLLDAAFDSWIESAHDEYKGFYEDDNYAEYADGNDREYYADGSPANDND